MLRPATPLSVIFFVAFVLLLLSTISTPVVRGIPLGRFQGYNFGVLGWCNDDGRCTGAQIGYSTDGLFSGPDTESDFSLPSSTRNSLSSILIVHPIAALLTLICFGLAVAAHFHGPSHSPRYLLALLILTIPTLLVALLAFLVDILLFVPHLQWGSWIVLGATILIIGSSIVTCAMRRTLVSRKARKKRIAENADMNGSTYYEQMAANQIMAEQLPKADSPPPMSGDTMVNDSGKQFATFESKAHADGGRRSTDDQTPLNPTPSVRSASTNGGMRRPYNENAPPMPRPSGESGYGNGMPPRRPSRDQYGNVIGYGEQGIAMGAMGGMRRDPSQTSVASNGSNGYGRGRGGYGPPPRGYGPPRGRGGYGPPRGGFRGGPPPPGWNGRGRGYGPPPGMIGRGGMPRQGPPPGYASDPYYGNPRGPPPGMPQPPPPAHDQYAPMGIGQAIEMDERTGNATLPQPAYASNNEYGLRDSDGDVAGMVGLQQGLRDVPDSPRRHDSDWGPGSSLYSGTEPRHDSNQQQWAQSPLSMPDGARDSSSTADHQYSGTLPSSRALPSDQALPPLRKPAESDTYYEDVDPRFAADSPVPANLLPGQATTTGGGGGGGGGGYHATSTPARTLSPAHHNQNSHPQYTELLSHPASDVAAPTRGRETNDLPPHSPPPGLLNPLQHGNYSTNSLNNPQNERISSSASANDFLDPIPDGARSPGEGSEASHFTSVSQRGVNPAWRPGPGLAIGGPMGPGSMNGGGMPPGPRPTRRNDDVILNANPDFSVPGIGPAARGGVGRGATGHVRVGSAGASGMTPGGRYPVVGPGDV
ncbi:unnamed protein product [Zymoseptoria tritici ST99CH_3D1]|nr:unnamed protein product [Zymoseptoria tritici ST99CH_3D1]